MRPDYSRAVYRQLINGKVINKHKLEGATEVSNELYNDIIMNLDHYESLYKMIGFELHSLGDSFLIRDLDLEDDFRDTAMKIQVLIDVINRGIQLESIQPEIMGVSSMGLSKDYIDRFGDNEEFRTILKACGMRNRLDIEINNQLVARGIAQYNHREALVFTDAGRTMCAELFKRVNSHENYTSTDD